MVMSACQNAKAPLEQNLHQITLKTTETKMAVTVQNGGSYALTKSKLILAQNASRESTCVTDENPRTCGTIKYNYYMEDNTNRVLDHCFGIDYSTNYIDI